MTFITIDLLKDLPNRVTPYSKEVTSFASSSSNLPVSSGNFRFNRKGNLFNLVLVLTLLAFNSELMAQGSIPCDGSLYFTRQLSSSTRISSVNVSSTGTVSVSDKVTLNPAISTNATVYYNGYVFTQNWSPNPFTLVRIANYNNTTNYTSKTVAKMPNNVDFNNAGVDKNGIMYILSASSDSLYKFDLKNWASDGTGTLTATAVHFSMTAGTRLWGDIAFDPLTNRAYVWYHPSSDPSGGQAVRGLYELKNYTTGTPSIEKVGDAANYTMGTLFFNERGQLFSYGVAVPGSNQVNFYYIDKSNGHVTQIGSSDSSPQSDGCECAYRLSLTLTAGNDKGEVAIPNCSKPSDFSIQFAANNSASGGFTGITFAFPLDPRFSFADTKDDIETYLKGIFGSSVAVTLSSSGGGTNNVLNATGLAISGTTANSGNVVNLPFALKIALAAGGDQFTNGEKVDFQATFGGLSDYYGTSEPSSDPLSLFGKKASTITFNKTNDLCNLLSGNVLHDANGLTDDRVNGTAITTDLGLKALLVNAAGNVISVTTIDLATGTYSFPVGPGTYSVLLTTASVSQSNVGNKGSDIAITPPSGWGYTGEHWGTDDGNDGTVNGILTGILVEDLDVDNANFGIQQPPSATGATYQLSSKPTSGTVVKLDGTVPASAGSGAHVDPLVGADPEKSVDFPISFIITGLPVVSGGTAEGTPPVLYYNGVEVNSLDIADGTLFEDPALFSIQLNGSGYESISFKFKTVDAAGEKSPEATYTINWSSPLPVTLISFTGQAESSSVVRLAWATAQESNASRFVIERSNDAKSWSLLKETAAVGESRVVSNYSEYDQHPLHGVNYYRLKMVDRDGSFSHSRSIAVQMEGGKPLVTVHPNPASSVLYIKDIALESVSSVSLLTLGGQVVARYGTISPQGLDLSAFANGMYFVSIATADGSFTVKKVVINK